MKEKDRLWYNQNQIGLALYHLGELKIDNDFKAGKAAKLADIKLTLQLWQKKMMDRWKELA